MLTDDEDDEGDNKNKKNGNGDGDNTGNAPGQQDAGKNGNGDDKGTQEPEKVNFSPEQQKALDQVIAQRLQRAQEKWEADAAEAKKKAEEDAEATRLEEQKKFEELAQKRATKVTALEAEAETNKTITVELSADRDRYKAALESYVASVREGIPDHLLKLLEALDPVQQLEYLTENAEALGRPEREGVPPTPKPKGKGKTSDEDKRKKSVPVRKIW